MTDQEKLELKIGEKFKLNDGNIIKCIEGSDCSKCYYYDYEIIDDKCNNFKCFPSERSDRKYTYCELVKNNKEKIESKKSRFFWLSIEALFTFSTLILFLSFFYNVIILKNISDIPFLILFGFIFCARIERKKDDYEGGNDDDK